MSADDAICDRCGVRLWVSGPGKDEATVMRLAAEPLGYCANCAISQYIQFDYHFGPRGQGGLIDSIDANPSLILLPIFQQTMGNLLDHGKADSDGSDINWQVVVDQWRLPWPKKRAKPKPKANQESML